MTYGARNYGTRSYGDSAPVDSVIPSGAATDHPASVAMSASVSLAATAVRAVAASVLLSSSTSLAATAARTVPWALVSFRASMSLSPKSRPVGSTRRVVVCEMDGTPLAEIENANVGAVSFELNRPEEWSFSFPATDDKATSVLSERVREVQLWRGDQLISFGPMVRPSSTKDSVTVGCRGALWHLGRRHIGKAERTNHIVNGDFENGLAGWTLTSDPVAIANDWDYAQGPPLHEIVRFPTMVGERALRLENTVAGAEAHAQQTFEWTVDVNASPNGDTWTLVGYVRVDSFTAAAYEGRGLYIERFSTTELNPDPVVQAAAPGALKSIERQFVPINEETPLDTWTRMEVALNTPPKAGEPELVRVSLYAPQGVAFWDRVSLTLDERLAWFGANQTSEIAAGIVAHLQDPAYGKSDANIATDCPPSGVLRDREYLHHEHTNGLRALEEFTTLDNGFDFDVTYTPTTRTFRTHYPEKGRHAPEFALELGRNIADFAWTFDGETAATSVIVLGQGDGPDREEASAIDSTSFAGGLTLEEVFVSPPDTRIDALDNIAEERLAVTSAPEILAVKTHPPLPGQADPIGLLWPGDTVPVSIRKGGLDVTGAYRVIRLTINPDDSLDLVLNRRELSLYRGLT